MRLFVAIEVPERLRTMLGSVQDSLDPTGNQARWVASGSIHLTLKFLGEIDPTGVGAIERSLAGIRASELTLCIQGIGFFPRSRAPRVIWAGIAGAGLTQLAAEVDRVTSRIGFRQGSKPFRPHLTLARAMGKGTIGSNLVRAASRLETTRFGSFDARSVLLNRSRLEPGGAVYEKIAEFVFTAPPE